MKSFLIKFLILNSMKLIILVVLAAAATVTWAGCKDKHRSCRHWVPRFCARSWFVKEHCKKSCNLCGVCMDSVTWCPRFKFLCGGHDFNVNRFCKQTCGECDKTTEGPPEPTTTIPEETTTTEEEKTTTEEEKTTTEEEKTTTEEEKTTTEEEKSTTEEEKTTTEEEKTTTEEKKTTTEEEKTTTEEEKTTTEEEKTTAGPSDLEKWKQEVLDHHNKLRSKVAKGEQATAPKAKYMGKMSWDKNLAVQAQAYADKCVYGHDKQRGDGIGENIAINSRVDSWIYMTQKWYDEVEIAPVGDYNKMTNIEFSNGLGHYTQVVWASSTKLGCGYAKACKMPKYPNYDMNYLVCRYKEAGNFMGRPIYETGEPCSDCDGKCENGLCDGKSKSGGCFDFYNNCNQLKSACDTDKNIAKKCKKSCGKC